jgi:hypothetical protein
MTSIPTPSCPAWCADHTENGRDIIHESHAARLPLAAEDRDVTVGLHRGDERPRWQPEVIPGAPVIVVDGVWLSPAEARDLAYLLLALVAQLEGVAS